MESGTGSARLRRERDELRQHYEARLQDLKRASISVHQALRATGMSSHVIARQIGYSPAEIRKLSADGDKNGWRPRSLAFCRKLDEFVRGSCSDQPELTPLRVAYGHAGRELRDVEVRLRLADAAEDGAAARTAGYARELTAYLRALKEFLSETQAWIPHSDLGDAFQKRAVDASFSPPDTPDDEALYVSRSAPRRGNVSWSGAMRGVEVAVVLADAGYGKTWLLRQHGRELCETAAQALEAGADPDDVEIPLWIHAGDLAHGWSSEDEPAPAVVRAAMRAVRDLGFTPSARLVAFLAERLEVDRTALHVLVDAYDEVFDDALRSAARRALVWLRSISRRRSGPRLVLTSRGAGYTNPFEGGAPQEPEPVYLQPGVLDEPQVRALWERWFHARGEPVPMARLEAVLAPLSPMRDFVRVPLIAAFCAWVAEVDTVATSRTGLYEQVVRRFLAQGWKEHGSTRQDAGLRATLDTALTELAWTMATGQAVWRDAIDVATCESELARAGLQTSRDHSRSWLAVREVGILVQAAARGPEPLGEGPVLWIHRSVQEFLVARKMLTLPQDQLSELLGHRAWMQPEWSEVIHFAVGLETVGEGGRPVTEVLRSFALDGRDGLGWFATAFAAAGAGMPPDPAARQAIVERVWALYRVGFLTTDRLANVLALVPEASPGEIVAILLDAPPSLARWEALAWCGQPGKDALVAAVTTADEMSGAATALYRVDPPGAVAAVRRRLANALPLPADDALVLHEMELPDVLRLAGLYADDPVRWAQNLGLTRHPEARRILLDPSLVKDPEPVVRWAALIGIMALAADDLDAELWEIISAIALSHEDRAMRTKCRNYLRARSLMLPWVEKALAHEFLGVHDDPMEPPLFTLDGLAARLRTVGPATLKSVVMLAEEPRLLRGPVPEALDELAERVLLGELDVETSQFVAVVKGDDFVRRGCALLRDADDDAGIDRSKLAVGLILARMHDAGIHTVYEAVVDYAGRRPGGLLEDALCISWDPLGQIEILLAALAAMPGADRDAVEIWTDALRGLLLKVPAAARRDLRSRCAAVTESVLALSRRPAR